MSKSRRAAAKEQGAAASASSPLQGPEKKRKGKKGKGGAGKKGAARAEDGPGKPLGETQEWRGGVRRLLPESQLSPGERLLLAGSSRSIEP
ncbi:UNVERIFIED_CONTAM: hypothetical protein K2H54_031953 [Gekko kuhli]